MCSFKLSVASKLCTTGKYYTETWKVPISSYIAICKPNLVTLTYPRSSRRVLAIHKREHRTTLALRYGETCLTTLRATSGLLVASCTKCVLLFHHSELTICKDCTKRWSRVSTLGYQSTSVKKWQLSSSSCCKSLQATDQHAIRSYHCQLLSRWWRNSSLRMLLGQLLLSLTITHKNFYLKLFDWAKTFSPWQSGFQKQNIGHRRLVARCQVWCLYSVLVHQNQKELWE